MIRWVCITTVVVLAAGLSGVETVTQLILITGLMAMGLAAVALLLLHLGLKDFQGY